MSRTKVFQDPRPRRTPRTEGSPSVYPIQQVHFLEQPDQVLLPPLNEVLDRRCSERELAPPSLKEVAHLLWFSCRVRTSSAGNPGPIQSRPAPAAGGLHALDLLISRLPSVPGLLLYDPFSHALRTLGPIQNDALDSYHRKVETLFPNSEGAVITLFADHAKLDAKYVHWQSLALRDAGALLATLGVCAAGLDMGFCFAGILGNELLAADAIETGARVPAGSAIFGGKAELPSRRA